MTPSFVSLRALLPGAVAVFALTLLTGMLAVQLWIVRVEQLDRVADDLWTTAAELQHDLDRNIRGDDWDGLTEGIIWTGTHPHSAGTVLIGADGKVLVSTRAEWKGGIASEVLPPWMAAPASTLALGGRVMRDGDSNRIVAVFPIDLDGTNRIEAAGALVYAIDAGRLVAAARAAVWQRFRLLAVGTFLATFLLGVGLHFLVSVRVSRLLDTVDRIGGGDLNIVPQGGGGDEIGRLASGLAQMAARLKAESVERDRAEKRAAIQNEILRLIAQNASLHTVLDRLCVLVETNWEQSVCSVMRPNEDGSLQVFAGPSLSPKVRAYLDGTFPDMSSGSCSAVMVTGNAVFVGDTRTDFRWENMRDFAQEFGIRSCWSVPIPDGDKVHGTFAISHLVQREVTDKDREMLDVSARLAALAISHSRAQEALRASEERFRVYADHSADALFVQEPGGRVLDVNRQACESLGYSRNELIGMTPQDFDVAAKPEIMIDIGRRLANGETVIFDSVHRRKDGTTFPVEIRARPFKTDSGMAGLASVRDITERKRAELALRESEERFRTFLNNAPVLAWVNDEKGGTYFVNETFTRTFGLPADQVRGRKIAESLQDHPHEAYLDSDRKVLETQAPVQVEETGPSGNGSGEGRYLVTKFPLGRDGSGSRLVGGIALEITERVRAEEAVRTSERRLALAVRATSDAIWEWNYQTGETYYSPRWYEIISADSSLPMTIESWRQLCHPDDMESTLAKIRDTIENPSGTGYQAEFRMRRPDGGWVWVLGRGNVVERDSEGRPLMLAGTNTDITERKRTTAFAQKQTSLLEAIVRGEPLTEVLTSIVNMVEEQLPGTSASILLLDQDERRLHMGAAPHLPEVYNAAIEGLEIGPDVGSCGTAAFTRRSVRVNDIATNPLWAKFKDLALSFDLRACWSEPILAARGGENQAVLGTFAVYAHKPGPMDFRFPEVLERASLIASIAIENERAARDLRDSEQRFRTVFESVPVGLIAADAEGRIVMANRLCQEKFGYTREQMLGEKIDRLIPRPLRTVHSALRMEFMEHSSARMMGEGRELLAECRDGSQIPVEVGLVPMSLGREQLVLAAVTDISKRIEAERRTRESEARKAAILDSALDCIISIDHEGRIIDFNPAAAKTFATTANLAMGKKLTDLYLPVLNETLHFGQTDAMSADERSMLNRHFELRAQRADGTTFPAELSITAIKTGELRTYTIHLRDITGRKQGEEALRESRAILAAALGSMSDAVFVTDTAGRFIEFNEAFVHFHRFKNRESLPGSLDEYTRILEVRTPEGDLLPQEMWAVSRALRGETAVEAEFHLRRTDTNEQWIGSYNFAPIHNAVGEIVGSVVVARDITERKKAEEELRVRTALLEALVESAPDGILAVDSSGKMILHNRRHMEIWRMPPEIADNPDDAVQIGFVTNLTKKPDEFTSKIAELYSQPLRVSRDEFELTDGTVLDRYSGPVLDSGGKCYGRLWTFRDVTERHRVEQRLQKMSFSVENAGDSVFWIDPSGKFIYVNESACKGRGYSREEMLRMTLFDLDTEFTVKMWEDSFEALRQKGSIALETSHRSKDGRVFPVEVSANHVCIGGEEFNFAFARDITERKRTEDEIRALNADLEQRVADRTAELSRLVAILEASPDFIAISVDPIKNLIYANKALLNLAAERGLTRDQILLPEMHPPETVRYLTEVALPTAMKEGIWMGETVVIGANGQNRPVSQLIQIHRDSKGEVQFLSTIMRDITELKLLEHQLRQGRDSLLRMNAELSKASRLKDEFLASMSHELRTPLNGVLALSESMQEGVYGPINAHQASALRDIEQSGRHLLSLINDILDLSKIEAGQITLVPSPVDVESLCQSAMRLVKEMAQKKRHRITTSVDGTVGLIMADPKRLKQVLVNLLSNAVKFTPDGGAVGLEVTADATHQTLAFAVWDTGIGIRPEDVKLLFQPFQQIDSRLSREYSGTGLGLALVRRIVELIGGGVELTSEPGKGSRFTVTIPWMPADPNDVAIEGPPGRVRKVLLVEDAIEDRQKLERYLGDLNVQTVVHPGAIGAVDRIQTEKPDLILLDLLLPDGDGWQLLMTLKADQLVGDIPVVVISVVDDRPRCLSLGASEVLLKPIDREMLRLALQRVVTPLEGTRAVAILPPNPKSDAPLILLAEDNPLNARTIGDFLHAIGYRVELAENGSVAVERAISQRPALILMDIQMPRMDGLEATRRLRAEPVTANIPLIAVTALAMPGDRQRCMEAGANEYLTKPISLRLLRETVERLLGISRKQ